MIFKKHGTPDELIIEIEGQLTGDGSEKTFQAELRLLEKAPQKIITFNFMKVTSINSANIGKFFFCMNRLKSLGRDMRIQGCSDSLYQTFQLIRMEDFLPVEKEASPFPQERA
ncbi:MAG: anti-sigma factor antagonist [Spirochaetaceae bacterium]|nr:MAG: anti-sigma factor antagonist [Spirochaetaceae bacterium]